MRHPATMKHIELAILALRVAARPSAGFYFGSDPFSCLDGVMTDREVFPQDGARFTILDFAYRAMRRVRNRKNKNHLLTRAADNMERLLYA